MSDDLSIWGMLKGINIWGWGGKKAGAGVSLRSSHQCDGWDVHIRVSMP